MYFDSDKEIIGRVQRLTTGQVDMKIKIPIDELC